jgi:flagella basal body P-ring formation protein FlgA
MIFRLLVSILVFLVPISGTELACENIEPTIRDRILSKIRTNYPTITFQALEVRMSGAKIGDQCTHVTFALPEKFSLDSDFAVKFNVVHNGTFQRRVTKVFRVSGKAFVYRVAIHTQQGDRFGKEKIYKSAIDVRDLMYRMVGDVSLLKNYEFRNYVDKDQIVESWMLRKIPDIYEGHLVRVIYEKLNITLTLDAVVLENGSVGDSIKVKLEKNQKVCLGTIYDKKNIHISSC